jgi:WD40 repeat protein
MHWDARTHVRYNTLSDRAWSRPSFIARPMAYPWFGKLQPILAVSSSRLLVAAGSTIYSYKFMRPTSGDCAPGVQFEISWTLSGRETARDITGITFVPDAGADRTLYIGFEDGTIRRVFMPLPNSKHMEDNIIMGEPPLNTFNLHDGAIVKSLSSDKECLLSLSSQGTAALIDTSSASPAPQLINLQTRSWSSHLSMKSSTPFAAFGTSSTTPLVVHPIINSALCPTPSAILYANAKCGSENRSSAVYGISGIPTSGPWGGSDQVLVSGWYDGLVRVHDLRSSSRIPATNSSARPAPLLPVLSLYDSFEPIYAVSSGGGASSHIAAGSARHSVVAFWDVRSPSQGWSVHAPGNDSSPVYSIHLESSRLFGATQSRPFVYDFGPGVTHDTYPHVPAARGDDGLKHRMMGKSSVGYYVTKYRHSRNSS